MMIMPDIAQIDWDIAIWRPVPTLNLLRANTNCTAIWMALKRDVMPPAAARLATPMAIRVHILFRPPNSWSDLHRHVRPVVC
jgi:hypothetical protein